MHGVAFTAHTTLHTKQGYILDKNMLPYLQILSHLHHNVTLKAFRRDAEDRVVDIIYSLKDQMTDAADSFSSAVRQGLGKLPTDGVKVKLSGET